MQDFVAALWKKSTNCFAAPPQKWPVEWYAAVEQLSYMLSQCSTEERRELFEFVTKMDPETVLPAQLPAYWFMTHPSFEVFEDWLNDEALNIAYADHLRVLSSLGHFGTSRQSWKKGRKTYRRALRRAKLQKRPALHRLYADLLVQYFPEASIENGRLVIWPSDFHTQLEGALLQSRLEYVRGLYRKTLELRRNVVWSYHPLSDNVPQNFDKTDEEMIVSELDLGKIQLAYEVTAETNYGPVRPGNLKLSLEAAMVSLVRNGRWVHSGLICHQVHSVRLSNVVVKKNMLLTGDIIKCFEASVPDPWAKKIRTIREGRLPIGVKLHSVPSAIDSESREKLRFVGELFQQSVFKVQDSQAICVPPVGSVESLCEVLGRLEQKTGLRVFDHSAIRIQVCHVGDLDNLQTAILGVCAYLGSDKLRRYQQSSFETSHESETQNRPVIKDAGALDYEFEFWARSDSDKPMVTGLRSCVVKESGHLRRDVIGLSSKRDIEVTNLVATLMAHLRHRGYWSSLGLAMVKEVAALFERHQLSLVLDAPWLPSTRRPTSSSDIPEFRKKVEKEKADFWNAFSYLQDYAFAERERIDQARERGDHEAARTGILFEMKELLDHYDQELTFEAKRLEQEGVIK